MMSNLSIDIPEDETIPNFPPYASAEKLLTIEDLVDGSIPGRDVLVEKLKSVTYFSNPDFDHRYLKAQELNIISLAVQGVLEIQDAIEEGERTTIQIIGEMGAGKTTVTRLMNAYIKILYPEHKIESYRALDTRKFSDRNGGHENYQKIPVYKSAVVDGEFVERFGVDYLQEDIEAKLLNGQLEAGSLIFISELQFFAGPTEDPKTIQRLNYFMDFIERNNLILVTDNLLNNYRAEIFSTTKLIYRNSDRVLNAWSCNLFKPEENPNINMRALPFDLEGKPLRDDVTPENTQFAYAMSKEERKILISQIKNLAEEGELPSEFLIKNEDGEVIGVRVTAGINDKQLFFGDDIYFATSVSVAVDFFEKLGFRDQADQYRRNFERTQALGMEIAQELEFVEG